MAALTDRGTNPIEPLSTRIPDSFTDYVTSDRFGQLTANLDEAEKAFQKGRLNPSINEGQLNTLAKNVYEAEEELNNFLRSLTGVGPISVQANATASTSPTPKFSPTEIDPTPEHRAFIAENAQKAAPNILKS